MFDLIIGVGQGGSRLAKEMSGTFKEPAIYLNCADIDFASFDEPDNVCFVTGGDGTGRDAELGESLVRSDVQEVYRFIEKHLSQYPGLICLCVGGGGGSGTGYMLPVIELLEGRGDKVLLMFTIPRKEEGLPAKPQALKYLDKMLRNHMKSENITPLLIDNDYCMTLYRPDHKIDDYEYWTPVNKGVCKSLKSFYNLTRLDEAAHIDTSSGIGALDYNEFLRVLTTSKGFLDLVDFEIDYPSVAGLRKNILQNSKVFSGYDMRTAKTCVAAVALPDKWKAYDETVVFMDEFFKVLPGIIKTPYILRSSFYSRNIPKGRIMLMFGGLTGGKGVDKLIKSATKDTDKYESKETIKGLKL